MGDVIHGNKYGRDHIEGDQINNYGHGPMPGERPKVILLMSANPDNEQPLRLDEERREIAKVVAYAQAGDKLVIRTADAIRLDELQSALLSHEPAIAHFSGHGEAGGIVVTDDFGDAQLVAPEALGDLFRILREGLRCVVLNACYTEEQAKAIAAHVPCVIGMRSRLLDDAAIRFAAGFYRGIAHGRTIGVSFELGRNLWELHGYVGSEAPRLVCAEGYVDRPIFGPPV